MMAGRPRKPTALHMLQGTLRPDRHADRQLEPRPSVGAEMPGYLRKVKGARTRWELLHGQLERSKVVTELDGQGLARLCVLQLDFEAWAAGPRRESYPSSLLAELRQLESAFGMNPAGRAKVKTAGEEKPRGTLQSFRGGRA